MQQGKLKSENKKYLNTSGKIRKSELISGVIMNTDIFSFAIVHRNQLRFHYGFNEVILDPYYIAMEKSGKKVIYGRINNSREVQKFEFDKIANIKLLKNNSISPVIPILY
jgi:hypothetical protein